MGTILLTDIKNFHIKKQNLSNELKKTLHDNEIEKTMNKYLNIDNINFTNDEQFIVRNFKEVYIHVVVPMYFGVSSHSYRPWANDVHDNKYPQFNSSNTGEWFTKREWGIRFLMWWVAIKPSK